MNLENKELELCIDVIDSYIFRSEGISNDELVELYRMKNKCRDELKKRGYSEKAILCR